MSLLDSLIEMGFPRAKAEKALSSTGGSNLEEAINWIISNPDDEANLGGQAALGESKEESTVEITMGADVIPKESQPTPTPPPQEAKSIKCEDCGKSFRTEDEVQFHAAKSGHTNFSESAEEVKMLSEEEKRSRMMALQERLKQKRMEKEEEEKKAHIESEKQRRMTGQQMLAHKQRIEEEEMKKIADDKKKQKKEDALTKQRILDQIKLDREARKQRHGEAVAVVEEKRSAPMPAAADDGVKKSYDQCQLKICLMNGQVLKQAFGTKEPLSAVRLFVQLQSGELNEPFTFMTSFPKRVFNDEDMETPVAELGLVPAAVLIMTRK